MLPFYSAALDDVSSIREVASWYLRIPHYLFRTAESVRTYLDVLGWLCSVTELVFSTFLTILHIGDVQSQIWLQLVLLQFWLWISPSRMKLPIGWVLIFHIPEKITQFATMVAENKYHTGYGILSFIEMPLQWELVTSSQGTSRSSNSCTSRMAICAIR